MSAAVVTGAGRGIGRAVALELARRGLSVALLGRTESDLEAVADAVHALGGRALVLPCDVARADDVARACEKTLFTLGIPKVVVNNAGVVHRAEVHVMSEADWDHVVDVNLKGTFLVTRAFLPSMLEKGTGRMVAVASTLVHAGYAAPLGLLRLEVGASSASPSARRGAPPHRA